ncbi:hypothetical protein E4U41_004301 [Claviceps citrina]|nr:hypothetical protein E4U41_004301 [Claviceps citrina]
MVVDVFLAVLPATFFYNMDLTWRKKLGISVLLGLGSMAGICAAIKTRQVCASATQSDMACKLFSPGGRGQPIRYAHSFTQTGDSFSLYVLSGIELFLIIVCSSISPIIPVYERLFGRNAVRSTNGYERYASDPGAPPRSASTAHAHPADGRCGKKMASEEDVEMMVSPGSCDATRRHPNGQPNTLSQRLQRVDDKK